MSNLSWASRKYLFLYFRLNYYHNTKVKVKLSKTKCFSAKNSRFGSKCSAISDQFGILAPKVAQFYVGKSQTACSSPPLSTRNLRPLIQPNPMTQVYWSLGSARSAVTPFRKTSDRMYDVESVWKCKFLFWNLSLWKLVHSYVSSYSWRNYSLICTGGPWK